jgi:hypothetical protein
MVQIKVLLDEYGIINKAEKILPKYLWPSFIEALSELENNDCHKTRMFPKTRLHKVTGIKEAIYRADIDKISGWRINVQYEDNQLHLKDIIQGNDHDRVIDVIKQHRGRYS